MMKYLQRLILWCLYVVLQLVNYGTQLKRTGGLNWTPTQPFIGCMAVFLLGEGPIIYRLSAMPLTPIHVWP